MLTEYSIMKHVKLVHLHIDFFFLRSKYIRRITIKDEVFIQHSKKEVYKTKWWITLKHLSPISLRCNNKSIKIFYF